MNYAQAVISLAVLLVGAYTDVHAQSTTYLNKIFCHRGVLSDKMAFYFSQEPLLTHIPERTEKDRNGWKSLKFLLPKTEVGTAQAHAVIKKLHETQKQSSYEAHFDTIAAHQGPKPGLLLTVRYDSNIIGFRYETFKAIQLQP